MDPAHTYLPYWTSGKSTRSGSVTTVMLNQGGQTEKLTYTVTGNYVSKFTARQPGGTHRPRHLRSGRRRPSSCRRGYKTTTTPPTQG